MKQEMEEQKMRLCLPRKIVVNLNTENERGRKEVL